MSTTKIAIIDYQLSNLYSVKHACDYIGLQAKITDDKDFVKQADGAILPGVGAFGDAMNNLKRLGLDKAIDRLVKDGKPLMGVCLGMQLILTKSHEFGIHQGLNLIKGEVVKLPAKDAEGNKIKVPHMGWNQIYIPKNSKETWQNSPLKNTRNHEYMYFVHSYYVKPDEKRIILSLTNYQGIEYCSSLIKDNVFAVQYHPEKSGPAGLEIYRQWAKQFS